MDIIKITDNISYIEAVEKPLSADVVIVQAEDIISVSYTHLTLPTKA